MQAEKRAERAGQAADQPTEASPRESGDWNHFLIANLGVPISNCNRINAMLVRACKLDSQSAPNASVLDWPVFLLCREKQCWPQQ